MADLMFINTPDWLNAGGSILVLIILFAAVLYWQVADLMGEMRSAGDVSGWQNRYQKCVQLMAWVSVAPLLGLLGTVHGLLGSFEVMASGLDGNITQGMAQALITTEVGLMVAIPAWITLLLGQQRCKTQLEHI